MGLNGLRIDDETWGRLVAASRTVTADDVGSLLRVGAWRPVVMGAWFSLTVPAELIHDDLITATARSQGSLTAPPLAAAATVVAGADVVPAMLAYLDFIMEPTRRDGSEHVVASAVEHLGARPPIAPTEEGRRAFRDIHNLAMRLREAAQRGPSL
ncbi:hypothetical protein ACIA8K_29015 [Catenuloplanes sp. NPDC051500]|uniref:hypothetical protein n=1 Tax=Catenuloplanes sp. NPDC051500 TaxID=3363959 RepID=UPI0037B4C0AD